MNKTAPGEGAFKAPKAAGRDRLEPAAVDVPAALLAQDFAADSHRFKTDVSVLFKFLKTDYL